MKILTIEPGRHPRTAHIPYGLSSMQAVVGGYIQVIYPWDDPVALVCDEEGRLKQAEFNRLITPKVAIFGTFFICGLGDEDFTDLSDEMLAKYAQLLHAPEILIQTEIGCIPIRLAEVADIHGGDGNVSISSRSAL